MQSTDVPITTLKGTGKGPIPPMLVQYVKLRDEIQETLPNAILLFQINEIV